MSFFVVYGEKHTTIMGEIYDGSAVICDFSYDINSVAVYDRNSARNSYCKIADIIRAVVAFSNATTVLAD